MFWVATEFWGNWGVLNWWKYYCTCNSVKTNVTLANVPSVSPWRRAHFLFRTYNAVCALSKYHSGFWITIQKPDRVNLIGLINTFNMCLLTLSITVSVSLLLSDRLIIAVFLLLQMTIGAENFLDKFLNLLLFCTVLKFISLFLFYLVDLALLAVENFFTGSCDI